MKRSVAIVLVACGTVLIALPLVLKVITILSIDNPSTVEQYGRYGLLGSAMQWISLAVGGGMVLLGGIGACMEARQREE